MGYLSIIWVCFGLSCFLDWELQLKSADGALLVKAYIMINMAFIWDPLGCTRGNKYILVRPGCLIVTMPS